MKSSGQHWKEKQMSNDTLDDQRKKLEAVALEEERRRIVQQRKLVIDDMRTQSQVETIERNKKELEIASNINFDGLSEETIEQIVTANEEYIDAARVSMTFINDEFKGIIPFFQKNLIFIGGKTGEGKSTTVANIAYTTMQQESLATGKRRRVLVITNEEKSEDVYNRVTCLGRGWSYTNHDQFTDEQKQVFSQSIRAMAKTRALTVIDNDYQGAHGLTTSIEGICNIFDNMIRDKVYYDVILIDYYQNIKQSKKDTTLDEFKVQAKLAAVLDIYKNVYPAPIVLFGQVNPPDKEDKTPFQFRIKGRKTIMDVSTCVVEMIADRENYRTQWSIHKSRFNGSVGKGFWTGFSRGKFVPYDHTFIAEVARLKEQRMFNKAGVATKEDKENGVILKEKMGKKE